MTRKHLTPNQIKVLRRIYDSPEPLVLDNKDRRTLNVLARKNLITFKYCEGVGSKYYDAIECKPKATLARVEQIIAESVGKQ